MASPSTDSDSAAIASPPVPRALDALRAPLARPAPLDLWIAPLPETPGDGAARLLSAEETARAGGMRHPRARAGYIASRAMIRQLLGAYLGLSPQEVPLRIGPNGKPEIAAAVRLSFNLSHSGHHALAAVADGRPVGVDIERIDPARPILRLARRFFAPAEYDAIAALAPAGQPALFYRIWTRKEAIAKALALGLHIPFPSFSVWPPGGPAAAQLALWDVEAPAGYCAAAALAAGKDRVPGSKP